MKSYTPWTTGHVCVLAAVVLLHAVTPQVVHASLDYYGSMSPVDSPYAGEDEYYENTPLGDPDLAPGPVPGGGAVADPTCAAAVMAAELPLFAGPPITLGDSPTFAASDVLAGPCPGTLCATVAGINVEASGCAPAEMCCAYGTLTIYPTGVSTEFCVEACPGAAGAGTVPEPALSDYEPISVFTPPPVALMPVEPPASAAPTLAPAPTPTLTTLAPMAPAPVASEERSLPPESAASDAASGTLPDDPEAASVLSLAAPVGARLLCAAFAVGAIGMLLNV